MVSRPRGVTLGGARVRLSLPHGGMPPPDVGPIRLRADLLNARYGGRCRRSRDLLSRQHAFIALIDYGRALRRVCRRPGPIPWWAVQYQVDRYIAADGRRDLAADIARMLRRPVRPAAPPAWWHLSHD